MQSHPGDTLIRPMQSDDRDAVIGLLAGSEPWTTLGFSSSDWEKIFAPIPQSRDCFVVTCRGRIAGVGIVRPKFLFGDYLELLGIAPDRKGQGLGRQLLAHIEQVAFARGKPLRPCDRLQSSSPRVLCQAWLSGGWPSGQSAHRRLGGDSLAQDDRSGPGR